MFHSMVFNYCVWGLLCVKIFPNSSQIWTLTHITIVWMNVNPKFDIGGTRSCGVAWLLTILDMGKHFWCDKHLLKGIVCPSVCLSVCVYVTLFLHICKVHTCDVIMYLLSHHWALRSCFQMNGLLFWLMWYAKESYTKKKPSHCSVREVYLSWLTLARFEYTCNFLLEFLRN